jgi:C_GCAxxG_C_C family probable redox protein
MALQDALELENDALARASTAMTGGIAGKGDTCGALLGAVMFISMIYGVDRNSLRDVERLIKTAVRTQELYDWFTGKNTTTNCRQMITNFGNGTFYDLGKPRKAGIKPWRPASWKAAPGS